MPVISLGRGALPPGGGVRLTLAPKLRYDLAGRAPNAESVQTCTWLVLDDAAAPGAAWVLPVDSLVKFTRPGAGPGRGGVVRVLLLRRAAHIDRARFGHHWREVHAPLALRMAPSFDHYLTNVVQDDAAPWDGVLMQWFASEDVFDGHEGGLAAHKAAVAADIPNFVADVAASPQFLGREVLP